MSSWKTYELGQISEIYNGSTPSTKIPEFWNGNIIWITPKDLSDQNQKYILAGERTITAKALSMQKTKILPKGTVLLSSRAPIGLLSIASTELATNQGFKNIVVNDEFLYNEFLYYLLKLKKTELNNLGSGTTFKEISKKTLEKYKIKIPNPHTQHSIAKVLSDLDSKIELNNKINRELESMAKTLYDYWFVQFDFPNEEGKPYKSSGGKMVYNAELKREIPEGWKVKKLLEITDVSNESINPMLTPEKVFKHYSIPTFDESGTYGIENGAEIHSNKFLVNEFDILVSKLNPWFNRVIYSLNEENLICSTEFVVWRTTNLQNKNHLYLLATSQQFITYCTQSATGTSNSHKRVNPNVMMRYKNPYNARIVQEFGIVIDSWIKTSITKQKENKYLSQLRDWLLPMLMNGQVKVSYH